MLKHDKLCNIAHGQLKYSFSVTGGPGLEICAVFAGKVKIKRQRERERERERGSHRLLEYSDRWR
jgi:hypothetical protein